MRKNDTNQYVKAAGQLWENASQANEYAISQHVKQGLGSAIVDMLVAGPANPIVPMKAMEQLVGRSNNPINNNTGDPNRNTGRAAGKRSILKSRKDIIKRSFADQKVIHNAERNRELNPTGWETQIGSYNRRSGSRRIGDRSRRSGTPFGKQTSYGSYQKYSKQYDKRNNRAAGYAGGYSASRKGRTSARSRSRRR